MTLLVETIFNQTGTTTPPGGQMAGMPPTSVRITHEETGVVAVCGLHRSNHKNRTVALEMIEWALLSDGIDIRAALGEKK